MALARDHGAGRDLAAALNARGLLAREEDRYADAARDHEEALRVARSAADRTNAGGNERAETLGTEALAVFRRLQDTGQTAEMLFTLGVVASFQRQHERAVTRLEESLALHRDRGDDARARPVRRGHEPVPRDRQSDVPVVVPGGLRGDRGHAWPA